MESLRNKKGELFVYLMENGYTRAGKEGKADLALGHGDTHISSVYMPDVTQALGVGDMIHTPDALIFSFDNFKLINGCPSEGTRLEVFVARGKRHALNGLYNLLCDGELNTEMRFLREKAQPEAEQLLK